MARSGDNMLRRLRFMISPQFLDADVSPPLSDHLGNRTNLYAERAGDRRSRWVTHLVFGSAILLNLAQLYLLGW